MRRYGWRKGVREGKFKPPLDPFESEKKIGRIEAPLDYVENEFKSASTSTADRVAYGNWLKDVTEQQAHLKFGAEFRDWLVKKQNPNLPDGGWGRGGRTPHQWASNRPIVTLPGVSDYLDSFGKAQIEFKKKYVPLAAYGPKNLNEAYLYWKYVQTPMNMHDADARQRFLDDYDQLGEFNTQRDIPTDTPWPHKRGVGPPAPAPPGGGGGGPGGGTTVPAGPTTPVVTPPATAPASAPSTGPAPGPRRSKRIASQTGPPPVYKYGGSGTLPASVVPPDKPGDKSPKSKTAPVVASPGAGGAPVTRTRPSAPERRTELKPGMIISYPSDEGTNRVEIGYGVRWISSDMWAGKTQRQKFRAIKAAENAGLGLVVADKLSSKDNRDRHKILEVVRPSQRTGDLPRLIESPSFREGSTAAEPTGAVAPVTPPEKTPVVIDPRPGAPEIVSTPSPAPEIPFGAGQIKLTALYPTTPLPVPEDLRPRVRILETQLSNLQNDLTAKEDELNRANRANAELKDAETREKALQERISELETVLTTTRAEARPSAVFLAPSGPSEVEKDLRAQVDDHKAQLASTSAELTRLQGAAAMAEQLSSEIEGITTEKASVEAQLAEANEQLRVAASRVETVSQRASRAEGAIAAMQAEHERQSAAIAQAEVEHRESQGRIGSLEAQLGNALRQLEERQAAYNTEVGKRDAEIASLKEKVVAISREAISGDARAREIVTQLESQIAQALEAKEAEKNAHIDIIGQLNDEKSMMEAELGKLRGEAGAMAAEIEAKKRENENLQATVEKRGELIRQRTAYAASLEERIGSLEGIQTELASVQQALERTQADEANLRKALAVAESRGAESGGALEGLRQVHAGVEAELARTREQLATQEALVETHRATIASLENASERASELQTKLDKVASERQMIYQNQEEYQKGVENERVRLEREKAELENRVREGLITVEEKDKEIERKGETLRGLQAELEGNKEELRANNEEIDALKVQLLEARGLLEDANEAKGRLHELENAMGELQQEAGKLQAQLDESERQKGALSSELENTRAGIEQLTRLKEKEKTRVVSELEAHYLERLGQGEAARQRVQGQLDALSAQYDSLVQSSQEERARLREEVHKARRTCEARLAAREAEEEAARERARAWVVEAGGDIWKATPIPDIQTLDDLARAFALIQGEQEKRRAESEEAWKRAFEEGKREWMEAERERMKTEGIFIPFDVDVAEGEVLVSEIDLKVAEFKAKLAARRAARDVQKVKLTTSTRESKGKRARSSPSPSSEELSLTARDYQVNEAIIARAAQMGGMIDRGRRLADDRKFAEFEKELEAQNAASEAERAGELEEERQRILQTARDYPVNEAIIARAAQMGGMIDRGRRLAVEREFAEFEKELATKREIREREIENAMAEVREYEERREYEWLLREHERYVDFLRDMSLAERDRQRHLQSQTGEGPATPIPDPVTIAEAGYDSSDMASIDVGAGDGSDVEFAASDLTDAYADLKSIEIIIEAGDPEIKGEAAGHVKEALKEKVEALDTAIDGETDLVRTRQLRQRLDMILSSPYYSQGGSRADDLDAYLQLLNAERKVGKKLRSKTEYRKSYREASLLINRQLNDKLYALAQRASTPAMGNPVTLQAPPLGWRDTSDDL